MSTPGFRFIDDGAGKTVAVIIDGKTHVLAAERSLLAGLLTASTLIDFFCAIGQCQRCCLRVNDAVEIGCLYKPKSGDVIDTKG